MYAGFIMHYNSWFFPLILNFCQQYYSFIWLWVTGLQSVTWAIRFPIPGVTAVIHGSSQFMLWATIWVKVESLHWQPSSRVSRAQGNTPDFILEHFIVQLTADTQWQPSTEGWNLVAIAITWVQAEPCKVHNKLGLQHHSNLLDLFLPLQYDLSLLYYCTTS